MMKMIPKIKTHITFLVTAVLVASAGFFYDTSLMGIVADSTQSDLEAIANLPREVLAWL